MLFRAGTKAAVHRPGGAGRTRGLPCLSGSRASRSRPWLNAGQALKGTAPSPAFIPKNSTFTWQSGCQAKNAPGGAKDISILEPAIFNHKPKPIRNDSLYMNTGFPTRGPCYLSLTRSCYRTPKIPRIFMRSRVHSLACKGPLSRPEAGAVVTALFFR